MFNHDHVRMLVKLALHHADPTVRAEASSHLIRMSLPVSDRAMVIAARRDQEHRSATAEVDARRDETAELLHLLELAAVPDNHTAA